MTPFALSGLLAGISSFIFGFFVLVTSSNRKIGRSWFLFTLSVGIWGFGGVWIGLANTELRALLAWRLAYGCGVVWIPSLFYHFVCNFLETSRPRIILIHYLISIAFVLTLPTTLFFSRAEWIFGSLYYGLGGKLYPVFFIWWMGMVLFSHFKLLQVYKHVSADKKNQIKYFFFATAVGFAGGSLAFLPNFGVHIYPWGNFTVCLYPFIMSMAIAKHRLMDINLIIRKTLIYSTVVGTLTALYLVVITLVAHIFEGLTGYQTMYSSAVAAVLISICFQPLRKRVQQFVDRKFFRQYVDREEKLYELSREVITHTTPEAMAAALLRVIEEALHPKGVGLYLRAPDGNGFVRVSKAASSALPDRMEEDNELANYFKDHPQPFVQDAISDVGQSYSTRLKEHREDVA